MKLFCRKYGAGQPLVILHGLFGISDNWSTLARQLGERYEVYAPDLRNHGQSPHSEEFTYAAMSADLEELLDDAGLGEVALVGHSMGGKVAMEFAALHPQWVSRLVVADIAPKYYPPHHGQILEALFSFDPEQIKTRREAEEQMALKIPDFAVRQFLLKNLYWAAPEKLGWRMNLEGIARNIENVGAALSTDKRIDVPALFIRGSLSNYIMDKDWPLIQEQFPGSRLVTLEGAGHWVHAERPADFMKVLTEFLES
jgi:esterase